MYTALVRLVDTETIIKLDQAHLETVLPAIGKQVMVVNGAYRGEVATLESINVNEFNAKISISSVSFYILIIFFLKLDQN